MNLSNISIFGLASDRMTWLAARQKVTSENVANAGTPKFQSRDVTSFAAMIDGNRTTGSGLVATDPRHIPGLSTTSAAGIREMDDPTAIHTSINGNTVNLEEQTIRAAETSDQYRMAAQLYRKSYDLLTMALTGR